MIPLPLLHRPATFADEPFLRELHAACRQAETGVLDWTPSVVDAWLRLQYDAFAAEQRRRSPQAEQEILLVDDHPAGRLWIDRSPETWRLVDLSLMPDLRGLGFGAHRLGTLLDEAHQAGTPIELEVSADHPARRLFERLGFVVTGGEAALLAMTWSPASARLRSRQPQDLEA